MKSIIRFNVKHSTWYIIVLAIIISSSCEGPEGPRGFEGPSGQDGINYTHSAIYEVLPIDWSGDIDEYYITFDVPEITEDIFYDGAVLVYRLIEETPVSFNMLPYTYVDMDYAYYMDYDAYIGSIDVFFKEIIEGINTSARPTISMNFKVVIIEGLSLSALKNKVDIRNLNAVVNYLNLSIQ